MARKALVSRCELIVTGTMDALLEGGYQEREIEKRAWRCNACRLVWSRRGHAEGCADRGHVAEWQDGPYYSGSSVVLNGVYQGRTTFYPRVALRRDPVEGAKMLQVTAMGPMPKLPARLTRVLDRMGPGGQRLRASALARRRPGQSDASRYVEIFGAN